MPYTYNHDPGLSMPVAINASIIDEINRILEVQLLRLNIGKDEIENFTVSQLEASLAKIDSIIANPLLLDNHNFVANYAPNGYVPGPVDIAPKHFAHALTNNDYFSVALLPTLQQRRVEILERLNSLKTQFNWQDIRSFLTSAPSLTATDKFQIDQKIDTIQTESKKSEEVLSEARKDQAEIDQKALDATRAHEINLGKLDIEKAQSKAKIWQQLVSKDFIAPILGVVLAIVILIIMGILAVTKNPIPDIFTTILLLILGFFFGQVGKNSSSSDDDKK